MFFVHRKRQVVLSWFLPSCHASSSSVDLFIFPVHAPAFLSPPLPHLFFDLQSHVTSKLSFMAQWKCMYLVKPSLIFASSSVYHFLWVLSLSVRIQWDKIIHASGFTRKNLINNLFKQILEDKKEWQTLKLWRHSNQGKEISSLGLGEQKKEVGILKV